MTDREQTDQVDDVRDRLLRARRSHCWCSDLRKPCTECDAYDDGLLDALDPALNGGFDIEGNDSLPPPPPPPPPGLGATEVET